MKTITITIEVDGKRTETLTLTTKDYIAHRVIGALLAQVHDPEDMSLSEHIAETYDLGYARAKAIASGLSIDPTIEEIEAAIP